MSRSPADMKYRPENTRIDPPPSPSRPSVKLHGSLKVPDGRSLCAPPTINLTELFDRREPTTEKEPARPALTVRHERESDAATTGAATTEEGVRENAIRSLDRIRCKMSFEQIDALTRPDSFEQTDESPEVKLPRFERRDAAKHIETEKLPGETDRLFPRLSTWTLFPNNATEESSRAAELPVAEPPDNENEMPVCPIETMPELKMKTPHAVSVPEQQSPGPLTSPSTEWSDATPSRPSGDAILVSQGLTKNYFKGKIKIPVLKGVDFEARSGEFVSIVGQSGSGKSTLLHLLGTLDKPDSGTIAFDGKRIDNLSIAKRDLFRNRSIGFIFQFYHLLPELTTLENVLSPLMIRNSVLGYMVRRREYIEKGTKLLEQVGLSHRLKHRPSELSGGEMQRAAIARALIGDPKILLADEPTGNLDASSAREIIQILRRLNEQRQLTIVMVTHDNLIAAAADRTVRMVDGIIAENE